MLLQSDKKVYHRIGGLLDYRATYVYISNHGINLVSINFGEMALKALSACARGMVVILICLLPR